VDFFLSCHDLVFIYVVWDISRYLGSLKSAICPCKIGDGKELAGVLQALVH
jgi:hypothetical protein